MHRPRPRTVAAGALVLLLAAAPFIPRGSGDHGAISPSGEQPTFAPREAAAVGYGAVTPAMRQEIDRAVAATTSLPRQHGRITARAASTLTQCADLEGQTYCLGEGWTQDDQASVQARVATEVAPPAARRTAQRQKKLRQTGDLSPKAALARLAKMSPKARAKAERAELTQAARSVAKVWMIRNEIQGTPLPAGFLAAHPEARVTVGAGRVAATTPSATPSKLPTVKPSTTLAAVATSAAPTAVASTSVAASVPTTYPVKAKILKNKQTAEQVRTYWCGPTSMQMIAWGWKQKDKGAAHWAAKLGTTSAGTAISDMVRVTNHNTGWDTLAGPYVTLDVKSFTTAQFWALLQKHIAQYKAPIILHPQLLTRYFPYLDHSGSGHFQVGRGYRTTKTTHTQEIGYYEPWNQQRFHPSEPYISRVQWLPVDRELSAVKANAFHNIGV
ncbi:C39 family peptidase [Nocardioides sp. BP30]|uniref:C39 family peptidase n=1 Tax=Nocardioides sp. BP30 TaxID=3036374 RepID=UPI002468CA1F|nr:C39 family peptidase [Nocardioides sp. BP30]WGL52317.1 C39 family peptidase [Nocardioides sp. BP30]